MLSEYQRGSIFGAIIVAVAFAASFSTIQYSQGAPSDQPTADINNDQQQREPSWEGASSDPIAVFTGALVFVGGVQALLFLWQLDLIRKGLADTKEAAAAAKISSEVADKSLRLSEDTAQRQLRAYVLVSGAAIRFPSPESPEVHVTYKNFGQTPAINVRSWIHIWIAEHPLAEELPKPTDALKMASIVLAPGMPNEHFITGSVPLRMVHLLGSNQGTVYAYGQIKYFDVFGEERETNYRLIYGGPEGVRGERMTPDTDGNDAT